MSNIYFPRSEEPSIYDWWFNYPNKALCVLGLLQSGKTCMINHFLDTFFDSNAKVYQIDLSSPDVQRAHLLYLQYGHDLEGFIKFLYNSFAKTTADVLFLDSVEFMTSVCSDIPDFVEQGKCRVILSGSSIPLSILHSYNIILRTMSFKEFLRANGVSVPRNYMSEIFYLSSRVSDYFEAYLNVGGYPAAVKDYIMNGGNGVSQILGSIVNYYEVILSDQLNLYYTMIDVRLLLDSVTRFILYDVEWPYNRKLFNLLMLYLTDNAILRFEQLPLYTDLGLASYLIDRAGVPVSDKKAYLKMAFTYLEPLKEEDMRDPNRIEPMLAKLREAWTLYPDMRLGQLIVACCQKSDIFGVEDDVMSDNLDAYIDMLKNALGK